MPCGKFGSHYPGRHSSCKSSATHSYQCVQYSRAALPIPISVCSSFVCPSNGMAARFGTLGFGIGIGILGFVTCAQMLTHAIDHWGCTATVKESALKGDWEKKSLAAPGTRTRVRLFASGFSVGRFTNWAIRAPRHRLYNWNSRSRSRQLPESWRVTLQFSSAHDS